MNKEIIELSALSATGIATYSVLDIAILIIAIPAALWYCVRLFDRFTSKKHKRKYLRVKTKFGSYVRTFPNKFKWDNISKNLKK